MKFETLFSIEFYCKGPLFNFVRGAALQNILIHDFSVRVINVSNKIKINKNIHYTILYYIPFITYIITLHLLHYVTL